MKRLFFVAALWLFALASFSPPSTAHAQAPRCRFFSETGGYNVCDDANAAFLSAFERWGLQRIGYPVSRRYTRDGFTHQAFQKAIMQVRPDQGGAIVLVNIFDDLSRDGFDQQLLATRQTPLPLPGDPPGTPFEQVVATRQGYLNARPALHQAYFSVGDPLTFFGLPTSQVQDMGNHYAIRLQRAVLQEWKENVPWARIGEVTIANGGDIAKELGGLPATALSPEPNGSARSGQRISVHDLMVGDCFDDEAGDAGLYYEIQLIPCDAPHDNEVYAVFDYPAGPGAPFPSDDELEAYSDAQCVAAFEPYVGLDYASSELYYFPIVPSEQTWAAGDREIVCVLYDGDLEKLVGTMRGSRR